PCAGFTPSPCEPFFFQAEDGIRCFHVTGVQTSALPIYTPLPWPTYELHSSQWPKNYPWYDINRRVLPTKGWEYHFHCVQDMYQRSEERRVGKKYRWRWWPHH